ncbi:unnamed protein product [Clonostachys solani]|uniref:Protein kinase domain-containing protein n=1 Tax=Clonostachys solani TaxID=160281 RepID=A0A9P0EJE4_9HYPO|nr:unnamed protein product [Clonostachys solani]
MFLFRKKSSQEEPKSIMSKYHENVDSAAAPESPARSRSFMDEEMMGSPPQIPSEPKRYRDQRPPNPPLDFKRLQASVIQHTTRREQAPPPPPPPPPSRFPPNADLPRRSLAPPLPPPPRRLAVGVPNLIENRPPKPVSIKPEPQSSTTIVGRMPAQKPEPNRQLVEPPGLPPQRIPSVEPPLESPSPSLSLPSRNRPVSDLVRDSKLIAFQTDDASIVRHIVYTSNPHMRQRRMKTEEAWKRREKLGTGAFGQVYLEELLNGSETGKLRAVKEIAKTPPQDPRKEIDYTRELEAIAKFSHPKYVHCFVKSYGWYESDLTIFITMEYASKGNLQGYLTKSLPEGEVKQITYQIAEGIAYMHENSFAHRDLKPANILVFESSPDWWVKISDFGISKRAEEEVTAFHTLVGTRGYLAPEILGLFSPEDTSNHQYGQGNNMYTVSVDLWALGAITFRLLTNQDIFVNPPDVGRYVILKQPFPTFPLLEKGIGDTCINFIENAMARSPANRLSAHQALNHAWLSELHDPAQQLGVMSTMTISSNNRPMENTEPDYSDSIASAQWPTWAQ